jgi:hypothetical protein
MMPAVDPREDARRRRAGVGAVMTSIAITAATILSNSRYRDWVWALWVFAFTVIIVFTSVSMRRVSAGPRRRGRGGDRSGLGGHARDDASAVGPAARGRRPLLLAPLLTASRLMPRVPGRRWLAEAESLLSEIEPARRGAAIRSYLLSAPRLVILMWIHEVLRAAARSRRPG